MHERSPTTADVDVTRLPADDDSSRTGTHAYADLEALSLGTPPSPSTLPSTASSTSYLPKTNKEPDPGDCTELEDYYRMFDPVRAKQLIDALPLSRHEICSKCAKFEESPVYSDRFFYKGRPLLAKEILPSDGSSFENDVLDFMPVHKIFKSNAAGIFYSIQSPETIDLKANLEPSILLLKPPTSTPEVPKNIKSKNRANLHLPLVDRGYNRLSERLGVIEPMRLPLLTTNPQPLRFEQNRSCKLNIDEQLETEGDENRSSLLMLEPLLLMSSRTNVTSAMDRRRKHASKKRLAHSEHLKLVRIVIAYSFTFLLLVSITFYVVYFT